MMTGYEMENGEEFSPDAKYPAPYPPNPGGYPTYPPGSAVYPSNQPVPPANYPNPLPTYASNPPPYYYGGQPQPGVVVTSQPGVMVLPQPIHKDYLAWSIFNLICCNLLLGILAVIYSVNTRDSVRRCDAASAASSSRTTLGLNIAALVLGLICHIVWISWVIYWSVTVSSAYNGFHDSYDNVYNNYG